MKRVIAVGDWRMGVLTEGECEDWNPAKVPGSVLDDLVNAGIINDPSVGKGEAQAQWVVERDFRYETVLDVGTKSECFDLVVHGLDTDAVLRLDGKEFAHTRNQHREFRFDLRTLTSPGKHVLTIDLLSPLRSAREFESRVESKPLVGDTLPYNAIRKMACSFTSDWGPRLATSGIWKSVELETWDLIRIEEVLCRPVLDPLGNGRVIVKASMQRTGQGAAELIATLKHPDGQITQARARIDGNFTLLTIDVSDPQLWWPRGYGDQPLYSLTLETWSEGICRDEWRRDIGFRTVTIDSEPDAHGVPFVLCVNGEPILVKGANWTPDNFVRPIAGADYPSTLSDAVEANMNLLRVWGGGIFESDEFYELCDHAGIMVWQDFLFSCACYSEEAELALEIAAEARSNIVRLATHASLVLWNGGNETDEGYHNWGFRQRMLPGAAWGDGYFRDLLPSLLADLDPDRPYIPSSPFSPNNPELPTDPSQGTSHSWKVWYSRDYSAYAETVPRFVAEFGFLGAPAYSTLIRLMDGELPAIDSLNLASHQKADDGFGRLQRGWSAHLPDPKNFDDWHFTTQLNQARAVRFGIQHFRSHWPRTAGSIVWQLKDCWPVVGYAAVDVDRHRKPLWHALRSIYADRVLMMVNRDGELTLVAGNDSPEVWGVSAEIELREFGGTVLTRHRVELCVPARGSCSTPLPPVFLIAGSTDSLVTAQAEGVERAYWYGAEDRELDFLPFQFESEICATEFGYDILLRSLVFAKDVCLFPDRIDPLARVDRSLVTLFPFESVTFKIICDQDVDPARLVQPPVVRSVNDLICEGS